MNIPNNHIKALKKVELHRHIEGCVSPELFHQFVKKYIPESPFRNAQKRNRS